MIRSNFICWAGKRSISPRSAPRSVALLFVFSTFLVFMCLPSFAQNQSLNSTNTTDVYAEPIAIASTGIYAQTQDSNSSGYQTSCRCVSDAEEFCQGTLGDTDIFLSKDGTFLHGANSSTCRLSWEYEFSDPIDKLAIDTTVKAIYFSSGSTVYALSLDKKEIIFSKEMTDIIKNISIQPGERLSIDLLNDERHYIDISVLSGISNEAALTQNTDQPGPPDENTKSHTSIYAIPYQNEKLTTAANTTEEQDLAPSDEAEEPEKPTVVAETNLDIQFENVANVDFKAPEPIEISVDVQYANVASVDFVNPEQVEPTAITEEPEVDLYSTENAEVTEVVVAVEPKQPWNTMDEHKVKDNKTLQSGNIGKEKVVTPDIDKPIEKPDFSGLKQAASCVAEIVLKPKKIRKTRNIYINRHGRTMVSMDFIVESGLCMDYEILDNIIKIKGPNNQLIVINNLRKTIQIDGGTPEKFGRNARPYRTAELEYYIPLREVMEEAGYIVHWSSQEQAVTVTG